MTTNAGIVGAERRRPCEEESSLHQFHIDAAPAPTNFCHNRDAANNKQVPYNLAGASPDSMVTLHTAWQTGKENTQVVEMDYMPNQKVRADIAAAHCHEIEGILFFTAKDKAYPTAGVHTLQVQLVPL